MSIKIELYTMNFVNTNENCQKLTFLEPTHFVQLDYISFQRLATQFHLVIIGYSELFKKGRQCIQRPFSKWPSSKPIASNHLGALWASYQTMQDKIINYGWRNVAFSAVSFQIPQNKTQ